jgi:hypothetical protein
MSNDLDIPNATEMLRQATMTAREYLLHAKRDIDDVFGDGYAEKNPDLVSAYMQTAAADYSTARKVSTAMCFAATLVQMVEAKGS